MDDADSLPTNVAECNRLLMTAYQQSVQLQRRTEDVEQQVAELDRVLEATSASFQELRQEHTSTLEELAWYKRWVHGRRERIFEGEGQLHLFDLTLPVDTKVPVPAKESRQQIVGVN